MVGRVFRVQLPATAAAGDHERAILTFEGALALWRGPVLEDLRDGPILHAFATWLEAAKIDCMGMMIECYMALGRHREVISRLQALIMDHPLREDFYCLLMLALFYSERRAEALDVYRSARRRLHDELGLEPCDSLQELQQRILGNEQGRRPRRHAATAADAVTHGATGPRPRRASPPRNRMPV
ncbi:AfsR/SARP family transcriptional regulator [Catenulispora rubra]|uniref:AfsR/SARP family transcriptional regulator n=1 Tax=Catenulispora rubra TaxID=280293 RepID=UPI001892383D|nr:AfsR/SARP family transcriptional regulator [Catenulispora rubra]